MMASAQSQNSKMVNHCFDSVALPKDLLGELCVGDREAVEEYMIGSTTRERAQCSARQAFLVLLGLAPGTPAKRESQRSKVVRSKEADCSTEYAGFGVQDPH